MNRPLKTLTVAELIDYLQDQDPDARVVFSTCYGDYHRTQQALGIKGDFEEGIIEESAYSNSGWALAGNDEPDEDDDDLPEDRKVLVLR